MVAHESSLQLHRLEDPWSGQVSCVHAVQFAAVDAHQLARVHLHVVFRLAASAAFATMCLLIIVVDPVHTNDVIRLNNQLAVVCENVHQCSHQMRGHENSVDFLAAVAFSLR